MKMNMPESINQEVLQCLVDARELLSYPAKWTKGCYAKNANGDVVSPTNPSAACFCVVGAVAKVSSICMFSENFNSFYTEDPAIQFLRGASESMKGYTPTRFNDTSSHEEVLQLFDTAIAVCESDMTPT
jgi:hypothetical protein